ncbi:endonuclease [Polaribacter sp.]|uniref:endonuclease n=1 Tax=Polaribacter sp. TaxID=1920175 RepID=UPI003F6D879F
MKKIVLLFISLFSLSIIAQEAYYNGIDFSKSGVALKEDLATRIISTHTNFLVYTPGVWEASKVTDLNPENSSEVLLIYGYAASGELSRTRGVNDNGGAQGEWNREHVYPRSLGNPDLGTVGPGADAHHLRPSDVSYNSQRGNTIFADGSGNSGNVSGGWYPGDEWKGDVARMMMYMYVRYGQVCLPSRVGNGSNANTPDDMVDLFLKWNVEDPVSDFERQRNTYHGNISNTYAQGNRNPFIDNAYLATRIWGGDAAEDSWGIFTTLDTEAPTSPTNVVVSDITTTSFNVSWTASIDNESVSGYDILLNGNIAGETSNTTFTVQNLTPDTDYVVTVIAKDVAKNKSTPSAGINSKTLADTTAPSVPSNILISNQTGSSFQINWTASTDNSGILQYEIFLDGNSLTTTSATNYNVTNLAISTTYVITIQAEDIANNKSTISDPVNAITTDGSNNISEIFFSEYVEGSGFNKAVEIVNLTSNNVDLSPYTIKRQSNGIWETPLDLSGYSININDVFVIINADAGDVKLQNEADIKVPNETPLTFNGDDRVGLFKNDVLIDIIGDLDGTDNFGQNITLRRNLEITEPTTDYNEQREWTFFPVNTTSDIGNYNGTLSTTNFEILNSVKFYPNPVSGNIVNFVTTKSIKVDIYNILGKKIVSKEITENNNSINLKELKSGVYLLKITSENSYISKKLIKN